MSQDIVRVCYLPVKSRKNLAMLHDLRTTTHGGRVLSYDVAVMVYDVDHRRPSFEHFKI